VSEISRKQGSSRRVSRPSRNQRWSDAQPSVTQIESADRQRNLSASLEVSEKRFGVVNFTFFGTSLHRLDSSSDLHGLAPCFLQE